jgi:uncharacterized protein YjbJ (UPF0337 family)
MPGKADHEIVKAADLLLHVFVLPVFDLRAICKEKKRETQLPKARLKGTAANSLKKENIMNKDIIQGKWNQVKGDLQRQWGKISDDELDKINGNRTKLLGVIQEQYGLAQDEAEKQLSSFEDMCCRRDDKKRHAG